VPTPIANDEYSLMRLLIISTWYPYPPDNGSKIRAYHLARALSERHDVTLIAFAPEGSAPIVLADERARVIAVEEDPFRHVNASQLVKYLSPIPLAFWHSRRMQDTVRHVAQTSRFDAVVAIQTPVAQYVQQCAGLPAVLDVDTSLTYQLHERYRQAGSASQRWRAWMSWQKMRQYEIRAYRHFRACTVVSVHELEHLTTLVANTKCRTAVITNGVDCESYRPDQYPTRPNTLVYNGALTYSANYDAMRYFLADIYPRLKQQVPEVTLSITGSTNGVDQSGLAMDDSVALTGYVPDLRSVVGGSAVCVVPIQQGGGTRLKILEAMALGVPIVATSKGAEGLQVVDGKHLLLADEPAAFAEKTARLLRDATLRRALAGQARHLVEQAYNWKSIGAAFVRLVEEVAGKTA
jgi:polysaccharide biosynthesis protein PslH